MNNKNKNTGFIKNSFLWVILIIVAVVGFQYFFKGANTDSVEKVDYTALVKSLKAGETGRSLLISSKASAWSQHTAHIALHMNLSIFLISAQMPLNIYQVCL